MSIKILDCTLRDGGYINDWNFLDKQTTGIMIALEKANIDIIECGYLNSKKGKKLDSTIFDTVFTVDRLLSKLNCTAEKVVMINYGDFDIKLLPNKKETLIDGIRLAFHKKDWNEAIKSARDIISLGYKLYFQPMVTKNYKDIEFLELIDKANQLDIYAFYVVDSFGSMTLKEFQKYMVLADNNLQSRIVLGYHAHNNMQLAFSNAISMCNMNLERDIVMDSSIYGIGRGAGNLNTELITDHLNNNFNAHYQILPLLEIIDEFLNSLKREKEWGFSPAQYLSASFNCHPNYATYLVNKNTNHIVGIKKVLEKLPIDKRSSFDKGFIEKLYREFLMEIKTSVKGHFEISQRRQVLLVASGRSVQEHEKSIANKTLDKEYLSIALNHKPKFECNYYFFTNQKRFDEFKCQLNSSKIIITSNVFSDLAIDKVLNFKKLVFIDDIFVTNVAIVMLNYLISKNISSVKIAGLDGYKTDNDNYSYKETSVINDNKELIEQNRIIKESLSILKKSIEVEYLTPSIFE